MLPWERIGAGGLSVWLHLYVYVLPCESYSHFLMNMQHTFILVTMKRDKALLGRMAAAVKVDSGVMELTETIKQKSVSDTDVQMLPLPVSDVQ